MFVHIIVGRCHPGYNEELSLVSCHVTVCVYMHVYVVCKKFAFIFYLHFYRFGYKTWKLLNRATKCFQSILNMNLVKLFEYSHLFCA